MQNNSTKHQEQVDQLIKLAHNLWEQGDFQNEVLVAEQLLEIGQNERLPMAEMNAHHLLADAQIYCGNLIEALGHCSWLIKIAGDPDFQPLLNPDNQYMIKNGYYLFVTCATKLPNIPDNVILNVLLEGLRWLDSINQPLWSADLLLLKSELHLKRGENSEAEGAALKARGLFLRSDSHVGAQLSQIKLLQVQSQVSATSNTFAETKTVLEDTFRAEDKLHTPMFQFLEQCARATGFMVDINNKSAARFEAAYTESQRAIAMGDQMEAPDIIFTAYKTHALLLWFYEKYQLAIDDLTSFIQRFPDFVPALIERAYIYKTAGQFQLALADADQAIMHEQQEASYFAIRSEIHKALKNYSAASADLQQALQLEPNNSLYWSNLSDVQCACLNYAEALNSINRAIEFAPDHSSYYVSRGIIYRDLKRYEESMVDMEHGQQLDPASAYAYLLQSNLCREMGLYTEALQLANRAIELQPEDQGGYTYRAMTYHLQGQHQRALNDFAYAKQLNGSLTFAIHIQCGELYCDLERYPQALEELKQAIALKPQNSACFRARGIIHYRMGLYHEAVQDFQQALDYNSYDVSSLGYRSHIYRLLGQYQEALQDAERSIELKPQSPGGQYTYACALWQLEQPEQARRAVHQALQLAPSGLNKDALAIGHFLYNLFLQRPAEAVQHFQRFVRNCQSLYYLQDALFSLRDFAPLGIEPATTQEFCAYLEAKIKQVILKS
ncbi:tetratricopeptide repeat protein [Dictyobacter kobayashii]|uniref:Uncharacterized protein n=1 Tax=Dictyobacter kobayashii TaxID=2014872 RepID=A0A402AYG2_9CHLR|nr:tetratricopeptide repeat protein [Dictyobacter kobayashii]GCE24160.1 hypothetical protein KDK_79600 [Dictyobacter kobayashii]